MSLQKSNRKFSNSEASAGELPAMELRGLSKNPRRAAMSQLQTVEGGNKTLYNWREYQRKFRSQIGGRFCDCGNPSVRFKITSFVCARCLKLEDAMALEYVTGNRPMQAEHWGNQYTSSGEASIQQRKSRVERMAEKDRGEDGFRCEISESNSEIIVQGHGEYHLRLAACYELSRAT